MIERIKYFKNIGAYEDSGNARIKFKPFTFIYAANTYGKTTFCDIFRSLKTGDAFYINKRRKIDAKPTEICEVDLTIDGKNVKFEHGNWSIPNGIQIKDNLEIFDVNFVDENFTNFEIMPKNKENLTSFILGERSVELIDRLKRKEEALADKNTLKESLRIFLTKHITADVYDAVINEEYNDAFKDFESLMISSKAEIDKLNVQIDEIDKIKRIAKIDLPQIDYSNLLSYISQVKDLCWYVCKIDLTKLKEQMDEIKNENPNISETWIKEGIKYSSNNCPFCGAELKDSKRVQVFSDYFSEQVLAFIDKVEVIQGQVARNFRVASFSKMLMNIIEQKRKMCQYIACKEFDEFDELIESIQNVTEEIEKLVFETKDELEKNISLKLQSFTSVDFSFFKADELEKQTLTLKPTITSLITCIGKINDKFLAYQRDLTKESILSRIKSLEIEYKKANIILLRGMYDDEIKKIKQAEEHIKELKKNIRATRCEIDEQESDFLNKYFESIQAIFKQLGGEYFSLVRETNERGKKKVYGIKIYYKNIIVDENRFCLSESDRRALALSIFLAKIEVDKNSNSILVLDDPITSFDKDRMRLFLLCLKRLKTECFCQVILLMHYENFFRSISKNTPEKALIKIKRTKDNHYFEEIQEDDEIFKDEYEKALDRIIQFIKADINDIAENDVRVFLENYLKRYYAYEVSNNGALKGGTLHNFILNLAKENYIDKKNKDELTEMVALLNDTSHAFYEYSEEDKRSFVKKVYSCLHSLHS